MSPFEWVVAVAAGISLLLQVTAVKYLRGVLAAVRTCAEVPPLPAMVPPSPASSPSKPKDKTMFDPLEPDEVDEFDRRMLSQ